MVQESPSSRKGFCFPWTTMRKTSVLLTVFILGITPLDRSSRDVQAVNEATKNIFRCKFINILFDCYCRRGKLTILKLILIALSLQRLKEKLYYWSIIGKVASRFVCRSKQELQQLQYVPCTCITRHLSAQIFTDLSLSKLVSSLHLIRIFRFQWQTLKYHERNLNNT